jgi:hypothetical protein
MTIDEICKGINDTGARMIMLDFGTSLRLLNAAAEADAAAARLDRWLSRSRDRLLNAPVITPALTARMSGGEAVA